MNACIKCGTILKKWMVKCPICPVKEEIKSKSKEKKGKGDK